MSTVVLTCIIVDPITRAKLWERYGFIGAEALVEELVPYLDCGECLLCYYRVYIHRVC
jgi:hypothetical protein